MGRNRVSRRFTSAVIGLLGLMAGTPGFGAEEEAIESGKRDLAEIEQRVRDLEQDLDSRRRRRVALLNDLERSERDVADLARAGFQLAAMATEQEQALQELQAKLEKERDELQRERAALGGLLRSAYTMGRGDRIRMLLDQEDVQRLSRAMPYYGYLNRYRIRRIGAVAEQANRLKQLKQASEEEAQRLAMLAQSQDNTRRRLARALKEREALLSALDKTIATQQERVADLKSEAEGLRALLEQLERRARILPEADVRQEPLSQRRGRLAWPLSDAHLLSRYGAPKGSEGQNWDGVVLRAEEGSQVRAVHHGRVAYADWLRGFGLLLIIEHEDGYMTLYGNNQTLLKEAGEWVAPGDLIALSGSSGGRESPGLYFAIRHRGRPLDPERWCRSDESQRGSVLSRIPLAAAERTGYSPII